MRVIVLCLMLALTAGAAYADPPPFAPNAPSDASHTYIQAEPAAPRPEYLVPSWIDKRLNAVMTRITGDSASAIAHIGSSRWGSDGRHQYSVRAAWSAHDSLIYIENGDCLECLKMHVDSTCDNKASLARSGSPSPSKVLLDGTTYLPINPSSGLAGVFNDPHHVLKELTWHPQIAMFA